MSIKYAISEAAFQFNEGTTFTTTSSSFSLDSCAMNRMCIGRSRNHLKIDLISFDNVHRSWIAIGRPFFFSMSIFMMSLISDIESMTTVSNSCFSVFKYWSKDFKSFNVLISTNAGCLSAIDSRPPSAEAKIGFGAVQPKTVFQHQLAP